VIVTSVFDDDNRAGSWLFEKIVSRRNRDANIPLCFERQRRWYVIQRDHQVSSAVRVGLNQIQRGIVQHYEFCRRLQPLGLQGKVSAYRIACVSRVGGSGIHEIEYQDRRGRTPCRLGAGSWCIEGKYTLRLPVLHDGEVIFGESGHDRLPFPVDHGYVQEDQIRRHAECRGRRICVLRPCGER
jgi:hypothetical protein